MHTSARSWSIPALSRSPASPLFATRIAIAAAWFPLTPSTNGSRSRGASSPTASACATTRCSAWRGCGSTGLPPTARWWKAAPSSRSTPTPWWANCTTACRSSWRRPTRCMAGRRDQGGRLAACRCGGGDGGLSSQPAGQQRAKRRSGVPGSDRRALRFRSPPGPEKNRVRGLIRHRHCIKIQHAHCR